MRFAAWLTVVLTILANWRNRGFRKPPPFNAAHIIRPHTGPFSCPEEN